MLHAVVARAPIFGAQVAAVDDAAARSVAGVTDVVNLSDRVAVIAQHTWAALKGRDALTITWHESENAELSSDDVRAELFQRIEADPASVEDEDGVVQTIDAIYEVPYLAHMTMEPQNTVAHFQGNRIELWSPTQVPQVVAQRVSQAVGVPLDRVTVHIPQIGGGFGRRLARDYAIEAAEISQAIRAPVKVTWTREDDVRHDFYRPMSVHSLSGGLDANGMPVAWDHHIATNSYGGTATAGAATRYRIPTRDSSPLTGTSPVPTNPWRAVFNTQNGFAAECFFDELAEAGGA